jgi:protein-tyrosine phosphatase
MIIFFIIRPMKKLTKIFLSMSGCFFLIQLILPEKKYLKYFLLHGILSSFCLGVSVEFNMNILLKNRQSGRIPLLSYLLWWPYHVSILCYSYTLDRILRRFKKHKEVDCTLIHSSNPSFYLGGRFSNSIPKLKVIIDLTNEIPRIQQEEEGVLYLNYPTYDTTPPLVKDMKDAIEEIRKLNLKEGSILVHCAYGRGRSCCMLVALLVGLNIYSTWESAFEEIKKKRPNVRLSPEMREELKKMNKT